MPRSTLTAVDPAEELKRYESHVTEYVRATMADEAMSLPVSFDSAEIVLGGESEFSFIAHTHQDAGERILRTGHVSTPMLGALERVGVSVGRAASVVFAIDAKGRLERMFREKPVFGPAVVNQLTEAAVANIMLNVRGWSGHPALAPEQFKVVEPFLASRALRRVPTPDVDPTPKSAFDEAVDVYVAEFMAEAAVAEVLEKLGYQSTESTTSEMVFSTSAGASRGAEPALHKAAQMLLDGEATLPLFEQLRAHEDVEDTIAAETAVKVEALQRINN